MDGSIQMARQANHRIHKKGSIPALINGYAQYLPFAGQIFNSVVATFPSEFIFDNRTLQEAKRVMVPGGKLVIVPMAWLVGVFSQQQGSIWVHHLLQGENRVPGLSLASLADRFSSLGFRVDTKLVSVKGSRVLVLIATLGQDST